MQLLQREGKKLKDEKNLRSRLTVQPPLRATASEDNAALGSLQASPQATGQTTGVAGGSYETAALYLQSHACVR
ncbi:UNVERIFIED_CONTAM: hypothetical protein FKN15_026013 [Acipenser sinensis]